MWKRRYGSVCALIACFVLTMLSSLSAQGDPSTLPLIQFADISYLGGFRLPDQFVNGDGFTLGGNPMAFNPSRNSLFIGSRSGNLAEVAIPNVVNSNIITQLPFATFLQGFYEPTEGTLSQLATGGQANISGLLVGGDRLYGSASIYYDANNIQRVSHYSRSTTLSTTSVVGMRQVWTDGHSGFVSGYMSTVPAEWQAKLGGTAITGQCCLPIAWRTSWGPSAFAFNPTDIATQPKVNATPLLYYSDSHPSLGSWALSNPTYGGTTQITGVAVIAGSRTVLFFGRTGTGAFCYGNGTKDTALVGKIGPDNEVWCFDPTSTAKGQHAYPYNYQIWAYDLNDLAAVKAGTKQPWDVRPYGVWPFTLPFAEPEVRLGGIGYDASRQVIYVSQLYADQDGYGYRPVIHALKVGGVAAAPLPSADSAPLPPMAPTVVPVTAVSMTADKTAPQATGTSIKFTATAVGGAAHYKFLLYDGTPTWQFLTGWTTQNTFTWTPTSPNPSYQMRVLVRNATSTSDNWAADTVTPFPIGTSAAPAPTPASPRLTAVTMTADKTAPQAAGSSINFTANAVGGAAQYKFLLYDGTPTWQFLTPWTTQNTFTWTPTSANPSYQMRVLVRRATSTSDDWEADTRIVFPIAIAPTTPAPAPPPSTAPAPAPGSTRVTAVTMTADKTAPQAAGTSIRFTAAAVGGTAHYKFLLYDGTPTWQFLTAWTTQNTFTWTPSSANPSYQMRVLVRSASSTSDNWDADYLIPFPIGTAAAAPAPVTVSARPTAVTIAADKAAPQAAGTSITFTAAAVGGTAHYKFLLYDGTPTWQFLTGWIPQNSFTWTPTSANPSYQMRVLVRSASSTSDNWDADARVAFPITSASVTTAPIVTAPSTITPAPAKKIHAVTLSTNKLAPQTAGATITVVATPSGGSSTLQYRWLIHDGGSWKTVTDWVSSNTFAWTPTVTNPNHFIGVWVRNAANSSGGAEATASIPYAIK
jgi:hypothetical protein